MLRAVIRVAPRMVCLHGWGALRTTARRTAAAAQTAAAAAQPAEGAADAAIRVGQSPGGGHPRTPPNFCKSLSSKVPL